MPEKGFGELDIEGPSTKATFSSAPSDKDKDTNTPKCSTFARKERCLEFIESTPVTTFMTVVTIYALYSDDVRLLGFDKSIDPVFIVFSSIAFFLFLIEIGVQCWCRDKYIKVPKNINCGRNASWEERLTVLKDFLKIGSFYFWLDLMATLSMTFELPWLTSVSADGVDDNFDNARAGKASRAGAKAARMLKVVRMVRLVRLVKLYKYFSENKHKKEGSSSIVPDRDESELDDMPPESHVGAEMSDRTTKKVIVGILIMLMVIPLLQVDEIEYINEYGMHMVLEQRTSLNQIGQDVGFDGLDWGRWEHAESVFLKNTNCISLLYRGFEDDVRDYGIVPSDRASPASLRSSEKSIISISSLNDNLVMTAAFDYSKRAEEEALLGILLTTFVILLLAVGTMTFSKDVNHLVILPIEKMVQLVREISANPLGENLSLSPHELKGSDDGMETTLLLRTISKIAGLMRIGFGEAGAEIIGRNLNMSNDENGGSAINLLGSGTKILSIFGFCDVRNFTDTTECLQEEVMLFVNRIAHILHSIVVQCDGAANKNIGDAFLLTWKLNPEKVGSCKDHEYAGDKALYSLLKTMVEMNRHEDFLCNFSPTALGALYERMPGYKCRIGCGLHFGWAVEGAIGSDKKIDASYISPHVNWAEFLESSTKQYDVPILLSEPFFKLLSPNVKKFCRKIDIIRKSETDKVTAIYTYDANLNIEVQKAPLHDFSKDAVDRRRTKIMNDRKAAASMLKNSTRHSRIKVRGTTRFFVSMSIFNELNQVSSALL